MPCVDNARSSAYANFLDVFLGMSHMWTLRRNGARTLWQPIVELQIQVIEYLNAKYSLKKSSARIECAL